VASIDVELAERLASKLLLQKETENAKLEIDRLLSNRGFPKTLANRLIKEWGNKAAEIVASDPYRLMSFRGIGFKLADRLYLELGHDPKSIDRQALCLWHAVASDPAGHSWFPAAEVVSRLHAAVGSGSDYRAAIIRGRELGSISEDHYGAICTIRTRSTTGAIDEEGDELWIAEGRVAAQEQRLAELIVAAQTERSRESQMITIYGESQVIEKVPATVMQCARCGRALTAESVFVVDGKPFGPTCIQYVI
jgi:hypothetical protein